MATRNPLDKSWETRKISVMNLPGLPTFAALLLTIVITVWLGIWGPIFSVQCKSLNDTAGIAAWAHAIIAGAAIDGKFTIGLLGIISPSLIPL